MLCKDCEHFHIDYEPIKDVDFGRASCDKYDLITDFLDHRKFNRLTCVEEEENGSDRETGGTGLFSRLDG